MSNNYRTVIPPHKHLPKDIINGYNLPSGNNSSSGNAGNIFDYLTIRKQLILKDPDDPDGDYININVLMIEDPLPEFEGVYNPYLEISEGIFLHKDAFTYGAWMTASPTGGTGGGCVQIGDRFEHEDDPARINLTGTDPYLAITKGSTIADETWDLESVLSGLMCNTIYVDNLKKVNGDAWDVTGSLSTLSIDTAKNWGGYGITNLGTITFGTTDSANLFRSAANTLKTDDNFIVAQSLFSSSLGVENTGTFGVAVVVNAAEPYISLQISTVDKGHIGVDEDEHMYISALGTGALILSAASDTIMLDGTVNIADEGATGATETYFTISSLVKHFLLGTPTGKNVYVQRSLHVFGNITCDGSYPGGMAEHGNEYHNPDFATTSHNHDSDYPDKGITTSFYVWTEILVDGSGHVTGGHGKELIFTDGVLTSAEDEW